MCTRAGKEYAVVSLGIRGAWNEKGETTMLEMEEEGRKRRDQGEKQREKGRRSGRRVKGVITPAGWVAEERARVDGWRPRGW